MHDAQHIEIIARGVVLKNDKFLLCVNLKSKVAYLPGGHIDFGECGRVALEREMREEIGCRSHAGAFLGCCEHFFLQDNVRHAEINLVYELDLPGINPDDEVIALESGIGFVWQPVEQLDSINFEPAALRKELLNWSAAAPGYLTSGYN